MFKHSTAWGLVVLLSSSTLTLAACEKKGLEACKIIEIEGAEVEVNLQDTDIERGEVEMVCGDEIIDVTWPEFKNKLGVDPGQFKDNLPGFEAAFGQCLLDAGSGKKEVQCQKSDGDYEALVYTLDD